MTILIAFLIAVPIGVALERKRVARQPAVISRLPTKFERDELNTPAVWRRSPSQQAQRDAVWGRVIEAQAVEVSGG